MEIAVAVGQVLTRSLDPVAVVAAADRATNADDNVRAAALATSQFIAFGVAGADIARDAFVAPLSEALRSFALESEYVESVLAATATFSHSDRRAAAQEWLSSWRFCGTPESEAIPSHAPGKTLCIVRAEDAMVDLLYQPLLVLKDHLERFIKTWTEALAVVDAGYFPRLRAWDPALAMIECYVAGVCGASMEPSRRPVVNVRFGANTVAGKVTVPTKPTAFGPRTSAEAFLASGQLVPVDPGQFQPHLNFEMVLNEVSTPIGSPDPADDEPLIADPMYGQVFQRSVFEAQPGIYGHTAIFEEDGYPRPTLGWLRVPFRAVPRTFVESRSALQDALADANKLAHTLGATHVAYRGQTREYMLSRSPQLRRQLYGHDDAIEPSLLSSGERRAINHPGWPAIWGAIVQAHAIGRGVVPKEPDDVSAFTRHEGDLIKLGLAQHYGLPTPALDLTRDPTIALWFALHELRPTKPGVFQPERLASDAMAVVYVFAMDNSIGFSGELGDYPSARPSRQKGLFIPISWGWARNRAARYLVTAIYFKGAIREDLDSLPVTIQAFPEQLRGSSSPENYTSVVR